MTELYEPPIFDVQDDLRWKNYLETEGYVVLGNILSDTEKNDWKNIMFDMLKYLSSDFDKDDRSTWINTNMPRSFGKAIQHEDGICQCKHVWKLRTSPIIKDIFSRIHETTELVSSMDAVSISWNKRNKSNSWAHVDQNPTIPGGDLKSIQGAYNYYPVGEKDRGFCAVPKSHKQYFQIIAKFEEAGCLSNQHYLELSKIEANPLMTKFIIPGNTFVLWNSKLIHANKHETQNRPDDIDGKPQLNRLTQYITMMPREWRSEDVYQKKIEACLKGKGTSHWANMCILKKPQRYPRSSQRLNSLETLPSLAINDNNSVIIPEEIKNLL
jgi:hypothetical protein